VPIEIDESRANDASKVQESLLVDLVAAEEFRVVIKVPKKPTEPPERAFAAVQPAGE
jgi:hypothetical protein